MLVFAHLAIIYLIGLGWHHPERKIITFLYIIKRNKKNILNKIIMLILSMSDH